MKLRHRKVVDAVEEPLETTDGKFRPDGHWDVFPTGLWGRRADDLVLDAELRERLIAAVEKLPESYRAVFMLRDFDGLSYEEIAEALETTVPAVKSRLHRARLALREDLATYFDSKEGA
jgi:RNA polymerase sigma-70 factor (ECF subfamily)